MSTSSSMKDFYIDLKEMKLEHNLYDMEILHNELNWCSMNLPIVSHKSTKKFNYLLSLWKTLLIVTPKKYHQSLQEIPTFLTKNSSKKNPPIVFLPPCPTWPKCHFVQVDLDLTILTRFFWLVFFIGFFLLNHCDNNIIWATTKNIHYFIYLN